MLVVAGRGFVCRSEDTGRGGREKRVEKALPFSTLLATYAGERCGKNNSKQVTPCSLRTL